MPSFSSFSNYSLPDYNFGLEDIYNFPKVETPFSFSQTNPFQPKPIVYQPTIIQEVTPIQQYTPMAGLPPKKTFTFTVADANETLIGASIAVNGTGFAQTDSNGRVTLPNIAVDSIIKISFIGYDDLTFVAKEIPNKVIMTQGIVPLQEVVVTNNFKKQPKSNSWLWLVAGAIAAVGIYKYSGASKVVRAKI